VAVNPSLLLAETSCECIVVFHLHVWNQLVPAFNSSSIAKWGVANYFVKIEGITKVFVVRCWLFCVDRQRFLRLEFSFGTLYYISY